MAILGLVRLAADGSGGGDASSGLGGFLLTVGWWLIPLVLVVLVVLAVLGALRRARQRERAAELAGQLLLAETMRELRERSAPEGGTAASPEAPET